MKTQCLYYVEIKIIIDSVRLEKGKTWGISEVGREKETREKEQKENKER